VTDLFLIAHLGDRPVAIDAAQVDSVVDIGEVVAVPRAEPAVRGLTALRSRVVTVIDTHLALGLAGGAAASRRAVITRIDGHHYAVLVDALDDVAPFTRMPLSTGLRLAGGWQAAAAGLIERDGEPVLVIDLAALVPQPLAA
jgi:purine-binding chemotaxis protein CheW